MTGRFVRILPLLLLLGTRRASGQLPMITVPSGALQIGLTGAFYPNDHVWLDGSRVPLGSLVDPGTMLGPLQAQLTQVLGVPVSGLSVTPSIIAAREHGVGDVGFGFGLTRKLTVFAAVPIVYTRSRVGIQDSVGTGRVGLNPANPAAQNPNGQAQTALFFTQFDAALSTLSRNLQNGTYAGDPALESTAQQTLASATTMRASLFTLLADPAKASLLLPVASDVYGTALVSQVTTLQNTLKTQLDDSGFTIQPAMPTAPLNGVDATTLITGTSGFGYRSPNLLPSYGIGDIEMGVAAHLIASDSVSANHWHDLWIRATARFATGKPADPDILLDQSTGSTSPAFRLEAIGETGHRRLGLRVEAAYQHALAGPEFARVGTLNQLLVPAVDTASLRVLPGDSLSITARPFISFAPHLAATAMVQYWRTSASQTTYAQGQTPLIGLDPGIMDVGSAASAVVVGIGLTYSNPGGDGETGGGLPVEAGWSIERTVSSHQGIFPDALTGRLTLRFYRPLVKH